MGGRGGPRLGEPRQLQPTDEVNCGGQPCRYGVAALACRGEAQRPRGLVPEHPQRGLKQPLGLRHRQPRAHKVASKGGRHVAGMALLEQPPLHKQGVLPSAQGLRKVLVQLPVVAVVLAPRVGDALELLKDPVGAGLPHGDDDAELMSLAELVLLGMLEDWSPSAQRLGRRRDGVEVVTAMLRRLVRRCSSERQRCPDKVAASAPAV
mmetsp:Transcript_68344/g.199954  ORF Transcript_68344/g.199954 Transcript_68344/m.199954 type:complete len:207 (-) Transcript_68344:62-682(-)